MKKALFLGVLFLLALPLLFIEPAKADAQFAGPRSRLDTISNFQITDTPYYNADFIRTQNYFRTARSSQIAIGNTTPVPYEFRHIGPDGKFFDRRLRERLPFHADRIYGPEFLIPTFAAAGNNSTIPNTRCAPYQPCNVAQFSNLGSSSPLNQPIGCIPDLDRECAPWAIPGNTHPDSIFDGTRAVSRQQNFAGSACPPFAPCNTASFQGIPLR